MRIVLIKYFKFVSYGLLFLILAPIAFFSITNHTQSSVWFTILIIVGFVGFGVISFLKSFLMRGTLKILFEECSPEKFLNEALAFAAAENDKKMQLNFLNWVLIGQIANGKLEDAGKTQNVMESKFDEKLPVGLRATFSVSFSTLCVAKHEISQAEDWMKKAEALAQAKPFGQVEKKRITHAVVINQCEIDVMLGKFEGIEDKLKSVLEFEVRRSVLVRTRLLLARAYKGMGSIAQAKRELEFVIENGNKLLEVEIALQIMAEM